MEIELVRHGARFYHFEAFRSGIDASIHVLNSLAMRLPPADLSYVWERFTDLATEVEAALESNDAGPTSPAQLSDAMGQLVALLARLRGDPDLDKEQPGELTAYGDYGLHLLDQLASSASSADLSDTRAAIDQLNLPFALWIVRNGGELRQLSGVVNALAQLANRAQHPKEMAELYSCCCDLIEAASAAYENPAVGQPAEPWRLLLLNRAIVATRSHNPELMGPAYDAVIEQLPADAERFFTEGMEQMTIIDYPEQVREVVRRYYLIHAKPRHLH